MLRATGRVGNPSREGYEGQQNWHVGGGRQPLPDAIAANIPPQAQNIAMPVWGDTRHPTRPTYRPPPVVAPTTNMLAATNAPARMAINTTMHDQGAARHHTGQAYQGPTAAVGAVSRREVVLVGQVEDVRRRARAEHEYFQTTLRAKDGEVVISRQRAEEAERKVGALTNELAHERLASEAMDTILREKTDSLDEEQGRNAGLKRMVETLLKERTDAKAWADEPTRGIDALARLLPGGTAAEPPRQAKMYAQWSPGDLHQMFMAKKMGECACRREFAANGLADAEQRFENPVVLGQGGFGAVYRVRCKKTLKFYAVKKIKEGNPANCLVRELQAYIIMPKHKNVIDVECLSDVAGSEGLVMEAAICDMHGASSGTSSIAFTLSQQLGFEADATEGLSFMHKLGLIHCDVKVENTLICRSGGPGGFVAKITDPGLWCGLGESRAVKTGTMGWAPPENVLGTVLAAPDQDTFAVGVDICFIVANATLKLDYVSIFGNKIMMTAEEHARFRALQVEGGDLNQLRDEVTLRTMLDGSLPRIFLQPGSFNPDLPQSELPKLCEVLEQAVSRNPMERPKMSAMTGFLRDLAAKTAALEEAKLAAFSLGIGNPPGIDISVGIGQPFGTAPAPGLAPPPGVAPPPGLALPPGIAPPPGIGLPPGTAHPLEIAHPPEIGLLPRIGLPAPEVAVVVGAGDGGGEGLIPLAGNTREMDSTIAVAASSGPSAAGAVVGAGSRGGRDGDTSGGGLAGEGRRSSHFLLVGQPAEGEDEVQRWPSMEWVHLAPLPAAALHAEGGIDGASTAHVPPAAETVEAEGGAAPPAADHPAEAEPVNVAIAPMENIVGTVGHVLPPLPGLATATLANRLTHALGTLGRSYGEEITPPPVASGPLAGQVYRGGGGGGGGDGGDGGGGQGFGGGRARDEEGVEMVGGPDTQLTFAQVLARGFGTSAPTNNVATPFPPSAPRPRVADDLGTPLTFAQVLARGFGVGMSGHAEVAATPPAAPPAGISMSSRGPRALDHERRFRRHHDTRGAARPVGHSPGGRVHHRASLHRGLR